MLAADEEGHVLYFREDKIWCRFCGEVVPIHRDITMEDVMELRRRGFFVTAADAWMQLGSPRAVR